MRPRAVDLALLLVLATLLAAFLLAGQASPLRATECEPEPASQWAPAGFICPPRYGVGVASRWDGPGVARNDCVWPFTACVPLRITNLANGRSITVTPVTWCHCWVGVTGPNGESERIVDLDRASVTALGLDWERGLFRNIRVEPASASLTPDALPDTGMMAAVTSPSRQQRGIRLHSDTWLAIRLASMKTGVSASNLVEALAAEWIVAHGTDEKWADNVIARAIGIRDSLRPPKTPNNAE